MTRYHFVLTLQTTDTYGATHTQSFNGTIPVDGKTRTDVLAELRETAVDTYGELMRSAVIIFFVLEPDTILPVSKEILL